jgi:hypothetical protein
LIHFTLNKNIEKPYPKKSQPLASFLTNTQSRVQSTKSISKKSRNNLSSESEDEDSQETKITFRDLCPEDKKRIGDLVKELAK